MTANSPSDRCASDPPEGCSKPSECPECHSDNVFPTFDPTIDYYECARCSNVFEFKG